MATTIAIANQKGGVGKTTTVIELCSLFSEKYKVLGIDLDGQKNFSLYAGADLSKTDNIFTVLNAESEISESIQHVNGYDIIPSDGRLSLAQKHFVEGDDQFLLQDVINLIKTNYDYDFIFIDCPPQRGILQEMSIVAAEYCIGVTKADDGGLVGLLELSSDIELKKKRKTTNIVMLGLLYNDYQNTNEDASAISELESLARQIGTTTFETIIRHSIKATTCKRKKCSLTNMDKENNVAKDYRSLSSEIELRIKEYRKVGV